MFTCALHCLPLCPLQRSSLIEPCAKAHVRGLLRACSRAQALQQLNFSCAAMSSDTRSTEQPRIKRRKTQASPGTPQPSEQPQNCAQDRIWLRTPRERQKPRPWWVLPTQGPVRGAAKPVKGAAAPTAALAQPRTAWGSHDERYSLPCCVQLRATGCWQRGVCRLCF